MRTASGIRKFPDTASSFPYLSGCIAAHRAAFLFDSAFSIRAVSLAAGFLSIAAGAPTRIKVLRIFAARHKGGSDLDPCHPAANRKKPSDEDSPTKEKEDMHVNEQVKNELQRLTNSLRRAMEQADCYSKSDLDDGLRESFWHDEYFRRKLECELMERLTSALEGEPGKADPTVRITRNVPVKSTSNFMQQEVLRCSEAVLDNAHKRLIEAKRLEHKAGSEEELNEANCAVYRAEREYNDVVRLHIRVLDLT